MKSSWMWCGVAVATCLLAAVAAQDEPGAQERPRPVEPPSFSSSSSSPSQSLPSVSPPPASPTPASSGVVRGDKLPPEAARTFFDPATYAPDMSADSLRARAAATSELRDLVSRYAADRQMLQRFHTIAESPTRVSKLRAFYAGWLRELPAVPFDTLSREGQVDYILLRNRIEYDQALLDRDARVLRAVAPLVPFSEEIVSLQEARQRLEFVSADAAASVVQALQARVKTAQAAIDEGAVKATPAVAIKAARHLDGVRGALREWFTFYNGYDPAFTAKVPAGYRALESALDRYGVALREKLGGLPPGAAIRARGSAPQGTGVGGGGGGGGASGGGAGSGAGGATASAGGSAEPALTLGEPIVGDPIGRDGLLEDLRGEMIVYTPEQLIEIGRREYAWTEAEMKKAARDLGFGDDWKAALEQVKRAYVPRGQQPALVRNLQIQAERFIRARDLVTIPAIVSDSWRMQMMAPQRMRSAPFFLGGESILVSYPVEGMPDDLAEMIMKGNGPHLSHATVFHELIPGHGLQGYMAQRHNAHRSLFSTPFYGEGWALYWELQLWDLGFHATPEDRIGALFWRMHRAARIVFTLNYQMGNWTPQQCVDFLVANGHERYTAEGEVRGHVQNSPPLYQISYLMGALQLRALYDEVVVQRKAMTMKQFNDAVLRTGPMPIEMVRALLAPTPTPAPTPVLTPALTRDYRAQWAFAGPEVSSR